MTTRYRPDDVRAIWAAMHEAGHGLDVSGVATRARADAARRQRRRWARRVAEPPWENLDRSLAAVLARASCPSCSRRSRRSRPIDLESFTADQPRRAGADRVDADEVTYSLHIILRFELEQRLVEGSLALEELPEAWNAGMLDCSASRCPTTRAASSRTCTGRAPATATSRPTRSGTRSRSRSGARRARDSRSRLAARGGRVQRALGWLRERLYRHGRKFTPLETLERAIGETAIDPQPYLAYLRAKVAAAAT